MQIRHKITLWITGAGILASLLFSLVIFTEMHEMPFYLIDTELKNISQIVVHGISAYRPISVFSKHAAHFGLERYWIKVYDDQNKILYQTHMTDHTDLPLTQPGHNDTVEVIIPKHHIDLDQDRNDEVTFRIQTALIKISQKPYLIQIAKPMETIEEEISSMVDIMGSGFLAAIFILIGISYFIAGKILQPISLINQLARDISEKTLDQRIPLGSSRDELYQLSTTLNQMFERLEHSFSIQKQFIANASHELKSPITLLMLFMEESLHRDDLPEAFRDQLIRQINTLRRLSRLVKKLLDLSALELKEQLDFKPLILSDLIKSVIDDYQEVLADKQIALKMDLSDHVSKISEIQGDKDHLYRALINLIDNAIKYNKIGGTIEICMFKEGLKLHLSLANTGMSIPQEDIRRVFDRFYRVEKSRSLLHGGSGLGLAIVKRIIELHDGKINIHSDPGSLTRINIQFQIT